MDFVWDARKAAANRKKHGVSFEEACTALRDPLAATGADPGHSQGEARWITFGVSDSGRLLVVARRDRQRRSHHQCAHSHTRRAPNL